MVSKNVNQHVSMTHLEVISAFNYDPSESHARHCNYFILFYVERVKIECRSWVNFQCRLTVIAPFCAG